MILGYQKEMLRVAQGLSTASEIRQQPATWLETLSMVEECRPTIEQFLIPLLSRGNLRVVLTGAGTSAFAGRALAPYLSARLGGRIEAVASTDIVTAPPSVLSAGLSNSARLVRSLWQQPGKCGCRRSGQYSGKGLLPLGTHLQW